MKTININQVWQCFLMFCFLPGVLCAQSRNVNRISVSSPAELKEFFRYQADRVPFVSAHRGGARKGYPENCIATFENTLRHAAAIMEIDPRLTSDSVVVLMHDATLERTTNGSGKVSEHTWEELQKLKLKDTEGNITPYGIPTLEDALEWARGKTILILDKKTVPPGVIVKMIREHHAESFAMVMAYSYREAAWYYQQDKDIMMEVFISSREKVKAFDQSGVPWENIVAFTGHAKPEDKGLYELIHKNGVMCIVGSSRIYDKKFQSGEKEIYESIIKEGADIIEADLAIEAGSAIRHLAPGNSSKSKYFQKVAPRKTDQ